MARLEVPVQISSSVRPLRIAYLIEDGSHAKLVFDEIFAEAHARWGGRNTLLVPVVDGGIAQAYWNWLVWYDPDLIYTYTSLSDTTVVDIHRQIQPYALTRHELFPGHQVGPGSFHPRLPVQGLSSQSVIPSLRMRQGIGSKRIGKLINVFHRWQDDGLVGDNFGSDSASFGRFPIPDPIMDLAAPLNIGPANWREMNFREPGKVLTNVIDLFDQAATDGTIASMSELAGMLYKYPVATDHSWNGALNLVVGDGFAERLTFWNARLLVDSYKSDALTSFRIPASCVGNETLLQAIGKYIGRWNWNSPSGQGGLGYSISR